jgi:hypothetical protein
VSKVAFKKMAKERWWISDKPQNRQSVPQKAHLLLLFCRPNHCNKSMIVLKDRNSVTVNPKFQVISSTLYLELNLGAHIIRGMGWTDFFGGSRTKLNPPSGSYTNFTQKQSDQRLCMMGWNWMNGKLHQKVPLKNSIEFQCTSIPAPKWWYLWKELHKLRERDTCQGIVGKWQEQSLTLSLPAKFEGTKAKQNKHKNGNLKIARKKLKAWISKLE